MCHPRTQFVSDYGPADRSLRAADHDREAVADILRDQHLAGRLDTDELQERVERCYAAKTYAELDAVLADLPAEVPGEGSQRGAAAPGHRRAWSGPRVAWLPLPVLVPLLFVAIALSHGFLVWLAIPFVFLFIGRRWRWRSTL